MTDIDNDLVENGKRLVIVFDNFDRLPKRHIQSIWSSIHIFFSDKKYNNIKVIIPFDRTHIKTAFADLNGGERNELNFANDYVNKTFDIVYRISPPIMSNWKSFFSKCWKDSVQASYEEAEHIKVEQVFEAYAKTVTPREMIAFINEVVSIKILHSKIPARYIGIFVLNKDSILADPLIAITEAGFLGGLTYLYKEDENFQRYITSLCYQIDPENALEIVYTTQLKDSLLNGDVYRLNEIAKTEVFSKIIFGVLNDLNDYEKPLLALDKLILDADISESQLEYVWDTIYWKEKTKPITEMVSKEHHKVIFKRVRGQHKKDWVRFIITELLKIADFDAISYAEIVDSYDAIDSEKNFGIGVFDMLAEKKIATAPFLELVDLCPETYGQYRISTDPLELNKVLSEIDVTELDRLWIVPHLLAGNYDLHPLKNRLIELINEYPENFDYLAEIYLAVKAIVKSQELVGLHLADVDINYLFSRYNYEMEFRYDLLAMRIAKGDIFRLNTQDYLQPELNKIDPELVANVSARIEYYINYEDMLILSTKFQYPLVKAVVQNLVLNEYQAQTANIKNLISNFDKICEANDLNPNLWLDNLNKWTVSNFDQLFLESIPELFYETSLNSETRLAKETLDSVQAFFDEFSEDQWINVFNNTKKKTFRVLRLIGYDNWKSFALNAFERVVLAIITLGSVESKDDLTYIMESFKQAGKDLTNMFKNIRDEFVSGRAKMSPALFSFIGDAMFENSELWEKSGDVFRTILVPSLLSSEPCLSILKMHSDGIKELLKSTKNPDSAVFKETIYDLYDTPSVHELADLLHFKSPEREAREKKK